LRVVGGILDFKNCENRCVTLLRNSNTQHWIPFKPPTVGKSSTPYLEKSPLCQDDIDSCHSSCQQMANYGQHKITLAHSHAQCFSVWKKINISLDPALLMSAGWATDWRSPPPPLRPLGLLHPAFRCLLGWRARSCFPRPRCVRGLKERPGQISRRG